MKKLTIIALALSCAAPFMARSQENAPAPEDIIIETLLPDGSTNTWTRADLVAALGLINRRYHRDVDTSIAGRKAWHGRIVTEIVDTNALTRTQIYEDGTSFTDPWAYPPSPSTPPSPELDDTGIPPALAEARARRRAEAATTNTVENIITIE